MRRSCCASTQFMIMFSPLVSFSGGPGIRMIPSWVVGGGRFVISYSLRHFAVQIAVGLASVSRLICASLCQI
jgi:hypothetical protein